MVAFNDRRAVSLQSPKDAPGLPDRQPGAFLSRKMINDRFFVESRVADSGEREYQILEAMPDGSTYFHDQTFGTRYAARKTAKQMKPTHVLDLRYQG